MEVVINGNVTVNVNQVLAPVGVKTIYGEINVGDDDVIVGTSLIIGKKYDVYQLGLGDDFSNCGFVSENVPFIATSTTPNIWLSSYVTLKNEDLIIYQNDVDSNITLEKDGMICRLKITNAGFTNLKTLPIIVGGSFVNVVNTNTIEFNTQIGVKYFKIEVLN